MAGKSRKKSGKKRISSLDAGTIVQGGAVEEVGSGIAERIVHIARPFINEVGRVDDRDRVVRSIIGFAVAAWNAMLMSPEQGDDLLTTVTTVPGLSVAELEELRAQVDEMASRRREIYSDDCRYVDNYRFWGEGEDLRFEARVLPG